MTRGQTVLSLYLLKKVFGVLQRMFLAKNPISESPCRFPLGPSIFNSRLSLLRTGLAGHPHQVFCPGSYPPKWQDVWHTFLVAKGVDNSAWGSKMTKIEQTPKCCWIPPPFQSLLLPTCHGENVCGKALPSINYSANAKHSFSKNSVCSWMSW